MYYSNSLGRLNIGAPSDMLHRRQMMNRRPMIVNFILSIAKPTVATIVITTVEFSTFLVV